MSFKFKSKSASFMIYHEPCLLELNLFRTLCSNKRPWKTSSFPMKLRQLLMKMYELMNIFFYFDWNSTKKAAKGYFLFSLEKQAKRPLRFALPLEGKCINKKTQHVDLLTYAY